jgi:hypothetical protein
MSNQGDPFDDLFWLLLIFCGFMVSYAFATGYFK